MASASDERRRNVERRQRERRARIADLQATHDELKATVERSAEQIKRLEAEQQVQLVRIAQIQRELDALKRSR
jgi:chromosome segregation ATPase